MSPSVNGAIILFFSPTQYHNTGTHQQHQQPTANITTTTNTNTNNNIAAVATSGCAE